MPDNNTPGPWIVRVRRVKDGATLDGVAPTRVVDCFVQAPDVHGYAYEAAVLGDDEYREDTGMSRKLADCQLIANAIEMRRLLREADRLYTTYGLIAGGDPLTGKWIGDVRDVLASLERVPE